MSVANYEELAEHVGHELEVVKYGDENIVIECLDCSEILVSFDINEDEDEEEEEEADEDEEEDEE